MRVNKPPVQQEIQNLRRDVEKVITQDRKVSEEFFTAMADAPDTPKENQPALRDLAQMIKDKSKISNEYLDELIANKDVLYNALNNKINDSNTTPADRKKLENLMNRLAQIKVPESIQTGASHEITAQSANKESGVKKTELSTARRFGNNLIYVGKAIAKIGINLGKFLYALGGIVLNTVKVAAKSIMFLAQGIKFVVGKVVGLVKGKDNQKKMNDADLNIETKEAQSKSDAATLKSLKKFGNNIAKIGAFTVAAGKSLGKLSLNVGKFIFGTGKVVGKSVIFLFKGIKFVSGKIGNLISKPKKTENVDE